MKLIFSFSLILYILTLTGSINPQQNSRRKQFNPVHISPDRSGSTESGGSSDERRFRPITPVRQTFQQPTRENNANSFIRIETGGTIINGYYYPNLQLRTVGSCRPVNTNDNCASDRVVINPIPSSSGQVPLPASSADSVSSSEAELNHIFSKRRSCTH